MQAFACAHCGQLLFFENSSCLRCGAALGFIPERIEVRALEDGHDQTWKVSGLASEKQHETQNEPRYRRCARAELATCNWMVPADDTRAVCISCALTQGDPPSPSDPMAGPFATAEMAKRRLVAQLLDLGLPFTPREQDFERGLGFVLQAPAPGQTVITGHANGLITLNLAESDSVYREELRLNFGEPYRTLLGHFRHEVGHYYWSQLVEQTAALSPFRTLFGDETQDYSRALQDHYGGPTSSDWNQAHVSAYAAAHPWEDWAETFAHYLHIRDVLQTAAAFGVYVQGPQPEGAAPNVKLSSQPARTTEQRSFAHTLAEWLPLTYALNALNRSMGKEDLYPFVLAPRVIEKLAFVHDLTRAARQPDRARQSVR